jgi:hypothetical protein
MTDTSPAPDRTGRIKRQAALKWVPLNLMRVSSLAQRNLNDSRVEHLRVNFNPEDLGNLTVSLRDELFWIIDGQHRVEAMRQLGWGDQSIQCWVYEGLTEEEEADKFLSLNDSLLVPALPKFKVGVTAGRADEVAVDEIVRSLDLVVSRDHIPGAIQAVGTLLRIYRRAGGGPLRRTLLMIREAYGDEGFEAPVIDGLGLLVDRYNGQLDDEHATQALRNAHGGVAGLLNRAEHLRRSTGNAKGHCVAAAAVDILNRSEDRRSKLPSWWQPPKPKAVPKAKVVSKSAPASART